MIVKSDQLASKWGMIQLKRPEKNKSIVKRNWHGFSQGIQQTFNVVQKNKDVGECSKVKKSKTKLV
jgi:hypothetical protein